MILRFICLILRISVKSVTLLQQALTLSSLRPDLEPLFPSLARQLSTTLPAVFPILSNLPLNCRLSIFLLRNPKLLLIPRKLIILWLKVSSMMLKLMPYPLRKMLLVASPALQQVSAIGLAASGQRPSVLKLPSSSAGLNAPLIGF